MKMSRILYRICRWLVMVGCLAAVFFPVEWGRGNALSAPIYLPMIVRTYPIQPRIAFISERDGNREIYTVSTDGSDLARITNNTAMDFSQMWSPDGGRLVYYSQQDGNWEIYRVNLDGTAPLRLTNSSASDYSPSWSPDGQKIVFTSNRSGNYEVHLMNNDGSGSVQLTDFNLGCAFPMFSPDGAQIAFGVSGELYIMNADGENQRKITSKDDVFAYDFDWSPDGTRIVFRGELPGNQEIYVVNADGTGLKNLTKNSGVDLTPRWSPDGSKIAYTCSFSLCTMNPDGSAKKTLAYDADQYPDWSPDSQQIIFSHTLDENTDIYVIGVDGTGLTRLTFDPAVDYRPVWQP